jgi:hypothetical protein
VRFLLADPALRDGLCAEEADYAQRLERLARVVEDWRTRRPVRVGDCRRRRLGRLRGWGGGG